MNHTNQLFEESIEVFQIARTNELFTQLKNKEERQKVFRRTFLIERLDVAKNEG
mgnify:CR=1 FL=1